MGIFDFLKKKKNKIEVDFDISSELIYVYPTNKIKLPTDAIVSKNYEMFLCDSGKILDNFKEGEVELKIANLPKCDKRFKLSKPDKNGKLAKFFFANVYFVNKNVFEYKQWKGYRKAIIVDKKLGEFGILLKGGYAFKIVDANRFVDVMLKEYAVLKNKEAEKILSGLVGEYVISEIEKSNPTFEEISDLEGIIDKIYNSINHKLNFLGVEFLGFNIEECNMPKRLKTLRENLENEHSIGENTFEKANQIKQKYKVKSIENNDESLLHFENQSSVNFQSYVSVDKNLKNEGISLDTDAKKDYDKCKQKVRCLFCGFENSAEDQQCAICGQNLKRKGRI